MADQPRDPWEGTELFPPTESPEADQFGEPARILAPGQLEEHRAEIIITVAVISLFPIFGLIAIAVVAMAWTDLRKMAQGTMDRSGRMQTIVGLTLGLIEIAIIVCAAVYMAVGWLK
jgi:hypothetical protein